jgi:asparagine synthase (glutamine-hydrolysing)
MCGITGSVAAGPRLPVGVDVMVSRLSHRGPDASGTVDRGACVLGHTRLRIIDLSPLGDQPMTNEDASVWLVFNGEIYNFVELRQQLQAHGHQFRSSTDSEVLVHGYEQWGDEVVHRLRGMFAFAIWDDRRQRLLLVRDRLGIKPVYYRRDHEGLRFASEASPLAGPDATLDRQAVVDYLQLGWVPGPNTMWEEVRELLPGHLLSWSDGRIAVRRYWQPPPAEPGGDEPQAQLREVLLDSMARHMVADVPVGLFLSGGIDSIALATLGKAVGADVRAFTVAFTDADDEVSDAAAVARRLDLPHVVVPVSGDQVRASLGDVVAAMDQPTVDGVNSWVISKAVRDAGIIVALSGLGGDELFRGYSTFRHVPRLARFGSIAAAVPPALRRRALATLVGRPATRYSRLTRAATAIDGGGMGGAYAAVRGVLSPHEASRLSGITTSGQAVRLGGEAGGGRAAVGGAQGVTGLELANYLPFQLLRDTDAMSMSHALEVRVPLLDDEVTRVALGVGAHDESLTGKHLLAAAAGIPDAAHLAAQPKRTFTLPFDAWLRGPLAGWARDGLDRLTESDAAFQGGEVAALWDSWQSGHLGWRTLWAPAVLGQWLEVNSPARRR